MTDEREDRCGLGIVDTPAHDARVEVG